MKGAFEAYTPLVQAAGATDLIRRQGYLVAMASERALGAARAELDLKRRRGVRFEILRDGEIRQLVPALAEAIKAGVFYPDVGHTVDPKRLVKALAEDLARGGASLQRARALGFDIGNDGVRAVITDGGAVAADLVVVAAGAWSKPLAAALGSKVPLDTERGYHVTLPEPGIDPRLPVVSSELRFCVTPMAMGLRLGGTVEFAGLDAPPDPTRHQVMLKHAKRLYPGLNTTGASYWMGHRPSLPDSLPVIGRAPRHANAYLAFGHGHHRPDHGRDHRSGDRRSGGGPPAAVRPRAVPRRSLLRPEPRDDRRSTDHADRRRHRRDLHRPRGADRADGRLATRKLPSTPANYADAVIAGIVELLGGSGLAALGARGGAARLHRRDQRHPRAQGRQDRAAHHQGLSRRPGAAADPRAGALRPAVREARRLWCRATCASRSRSASTTTARWSRP